MAGVNRRRRLLACYLIRCDICEEEEERTSKKASVLGTASAVRPNFWPIFPTCFLWFFFSYNPSTICYKDIRINVEVLVELLAATLKSVYGRDVNNQVLHGICPNASVASIV